MINVTTTALPAAPLHVFEIWSNAVAVAVRFQAATGFDLPAMGRSDGTQALRLMRFEPTVWLIEGDVSALPDILSKDGSLTPIGGGIMRIRISGPGWRALLMESGVFDAENPAFAVGCCTATIVDHVPVRLHVQSEYDCDVYVPLSFSTGLLEFWTEAAETLVS